MEILVLLIAGLIIGLLGKFLAPGDKDNIPIWLTLLCGIGGVLLGWFIYDAVAGDGGDNEWIGWLVSIAVATGLVMIASTVTGRNTSTRTHV